MRKLLNLPRARQFELNKQFSWLRSLHIGEPENDVQTISVSVFDHWLTRNEAGQMLENVTPAEHTRRNALHKDFCSKLVTETEVLNFVLSGRNYDKVLFRKFTSQKALSEYCTPNGGSSLDRGRFHVCHRHFNVAIPQLECVFYEGWDYTNHSHFTNEHCLKAISEWATKSGLFVLRHD